MGKKTFDPRSRQRDERAIVRNQTDFSNGLIKDVPSSNTPENSVSDLKNFINMGDNLEGRSGTQQWSITAIPAKTSSVSFTDAIADGVRTVTASTGTPFTFDDVGNWLKLSDGTIEKILSVNDALTVITTKTSETTPIAPSSPDTADIRGHINAIHYHKANKKIIVHVDNRILLADDLTMSAWTECVRNAIVKPSNNTSTFDEFEQYVVLFNSNGMFKINLDQDPPVYFRTNVNVPNTKITTTGSESTSTPYGYKYVYALSRIPGFGNRNRQTPGAIVEMETGTNVTDDNFNDYGVVWSASGVGSGNPLTVGTLTNSVDPITPTNITQAATHYSVYRTLDIGDNGTDILTGEGNNTELFVWVDDIPVCKAFTLTTSGATSGASGSVGLFESTDVGSTMNVVDGNGDIQEITIATVDSSTNITYTGSLPADASGQPACIGSGTVFSASQAGNVVTNTNDGLFTFASGDVGKTIYWADGGYSVISGFTSTLSVGVADSETRSEQGAVIDPTSRSFTDVIADQPSGGESWTIDQLRSRIGGYTLQQRFWTAIPNGNVGGIIPGFAYTARRGDKFLYTSMIPLGYEYIMGYYHAAYQFARFNDAINNIVEYPNKLVIRCKNSTHDVPTNTFYEVEIPELGEYVQTLSAQNVIDENIGSTDHGGSIKTDEGYEIVITNEPAIRLFDGIKYSDNLATDRIMDDLRAMNAAYATTYDPFNGFIFWGSDA